MFISDQVQRQVYAAARCSRDARFDGRFFVAVKTTGIFCRPVCPAKLPNEANVTYYSLAAQAMADGYRPCFRCRPDSAPHSAAWYGAETTINRATSLLSQIPTQPISTIASRLGISERYLNKLITAAIGLSPKQFQAMQQALFAKQLVQQTRLPLIDIALSCGMSSQRQLQRVVQQYCKTTPTALRKTTNEGGNKVALSLSYRPPYNWPHVRDFLALRAVNEMESVTDNTYQRWFEFEGVKGHFCARHNAQKRGFEVTVSLNSFTPLYRVIENIKAMLDLNADPMLIERGLLQAGLIKQQLVDGLRLPSAWSLFESGCRAILGQQVSVKAAIGQLTVLVNHLGEKCSIDGADKYCFPSAKSVANSHLDFLGMPQTRKNALRNFAQLFLANQQPSYAQILAIKGIGPWTVDYIKMRGERDPDIYLEGDLIVKKMAKQFPVSPSKAAPWRSYLTLQLWQLSGSEQK
ncbi:MAG: transcriptional regulator [Alteromonas sp.]|uniref:DNA-3-methyladenine glycosylase 2 family protein n=1 Tax=unclassified Alteromonas TaxID=2614992 RepID=UPI0009F8EA4B|nr:MULTISPECIES: AlkA N-terminal domain-containing protein [unclassified Alteromonas]AUC89918.1 DNA-3-methyladenine glycosylase 2 family protein [Alteromonas sp. MB-3u-76]MAI65447.1 transcriptional regulator [Alteromonas sp.]